MRLTVSNVLIVEKPKYSWLKHYSNYVCINTSRPYLNETHMLSFKDGFSDQYQSSLQFLGKLLKY